MNNKDLIEKMFTSFIFWVIVALIFPLTAIVAKILGINKEVDDKLFFKIKKYLDPELLYGAFFACVLLILFAIVINAVMSKELPKQPRNFLSRSFDEAVSQIIGFGGLCNGLVFYLFLASVANDQLRESSKFDLNAFAGLDFWFIAFILYRIKPTQ